MQMLTTMITPYAPDGNIDYPTVRKYVDWYFENGLDGILPFANQAKFFTSRLKNA